MINKTFFIIDNQYPLSISTHKKVKQTLIKCRWKYDVKNHNYLFVIGGDGTLVRALKNYYQKNVKIICINTGNVGFYARFNQNDIDVLNNLVLDPKKYINPDILEISVDDKKIYAINEVVIQALNTVEIDIIINDCFYEKFKGTGLLVCTKTGSTGQAKTNGGSIIAPNIDAIQLVELSPTLHANKITITSPLILNGNTHITLSNFKFNQRTDIVADGMLKLNLQSKKIIKIRKINAPFEIYFPLQLDDYINKLRKTFISFI